MSGKLKQAPSKPAAKKFNRNLGRCLLAASAALLALLAGEALIRVLNKAPDIKPIRLQASDCVYKRSLNPILGFELKPNFRRDDPDYIQTYERTNSHGQRDRERSIQKPGGTRRILLLGDSVVEGYGLPEEATISRQLERLFPGGNTEVLNFGVSAYCTLAEIELLELKGLKFDPDVVVLVFVENDFDNFNREAFSLGGTIQRPAWARFLFVHSHVFRLASLQWNWFHFGAEMNPARWNKEAIGDNNVMDGFKRFRELADEHAFMPLVAIWPRFYNDRIADHPLMPNGGNVPVAETLAALRSLPSIRLSEYFNRHHSETGGTSNPRLRYSQGDELHPSEEGAQAAALALKAAIQDLENGELTFKQGSSSVNTSEIKRLVKTLGADEPDYARVRHRVGVAHLKEGRLDMAVKEFNKALEEDPRHAGAWNNLGLALERKGDPIEARRCFERALEIQADFAQAHFNLARILIHLSNSDAAIQALAAVLKIEPRHAAALNLMGMELGKRRAFDEAEGYLKRALEIDQDYSDARHNLGVVYAATGRLKEARREFGEAVRADPANQAAVDHLRKIEAMMGGAHSK